MKNFEDPIKYARLFKTGQYDRLYILSLNYGYIHKGLDIYVLPKDRIAIIDFINKPPINENIVKVYGVVDNKHDWLHKGKWCEDFNKLVEQKQQEHSEKTKERERMFKTKIEAEQKKIKKLLAAY